MIGSDDEELCAQRLTTVHGQQDYSLIETDHSSRVIKFSLNCLIETKENKPKIQFDSNQISICEILVNMTNGVNFLAILALFLIIRGRNCVTYAFGLLLFHNIFTSHTLKLLCWHVMLWFNTK